MTSSVESWVSTTMVKDIHSIIIIYLFVCTIIFYVELMQYTCVQHHSK
jgi:hypothetical protein